MSNEIPDNELFDDIDDVRLIDLLSTEELQHAQDTVSNMARMAALITDETGKPLTVGSNFSRFCTDFCRKSEVGRKRCEDCDKMGAIMTMEQHKPVYYYCHANLVDFAAPILINGRMIGSFIGGQVLSHAPDMRKMRQTAKEIGVDEEEFLKAASETSIVPISAIERCTNFIYEFAGIVSQMAYKSYMEKKRSQMVYQAAKAKTDFLINMSHEIRTPMNAIIGMSQIALREEMSKRVRGYITQVRSSADMLLTIINDILDYSKLEAGKMSIIDEKYSPLTLIKDVNSIILNRVGNKKLEFIVDINPDIPCELFGDDVRIKQIMVNLANNAVKFTESGQVRLSVDFIQDGTEWIKLKCAVTDTGIGIKEEDIGKLFNSFEQVDSKRNRKVEGTGLGLAIVNELVEAMGGGIKVTSVYEKGSTFLFEIPQKVVNPVKSIEPLEDCPAIIGIFKNIYLKEQLEKDMAMLGVQYLALDFDMLKSFLGRAMVDFIFIEDSLINKQIEDIKAKYPDITIVAVGTSEDFSEEIDLDFVMLPRPYSIISTSAILHNKSLEVQETVNTKKVFDFKATDANILIVDDNEVNLTVAAGLLEPLEMHIDLADSGFKAIEMVNEKLYDIIFMDHMMPEMDGIETTHKIREQYPEYAKVPVIALTANAVMGSREKLLNEGMDDFCAKPIEFNSIVEILRKHLPKEKIVAMAKEEVLKNATRGIDTESGLSGMVFLDTSYAMHLLKSEKLYWKVLKDFYNIIDKKYDKIKSCEESEDIGNYIVEVHALKSSAKQIGALSLSKKAENLEMAGNKHDMNTIHNYTDELLDEYRNLQTSLAPYFMQIAGDSEDVSDTQKTASSEEINGYLNDIKKALDELDFDSVEESIDELSKIEKDAKLDDLIESLRDSIMSMDIDACISTIDEYLK